MNLHPRSGALTSGELQEALRALGENADAVYLTLKNLGIRGRRCSTWSCPVARYLIQSGFPGIMVTRLWVVPSRGRSVDVSPAITQFIRNFDDEDMYSDLLEEDT